MLLKNFLVVKDNLPEDFLAGDGIDIAVSVGLDGAFIYRIPKAVYLVELIVEGKRGIGF